MEKIFKEYNDRIFNYLVVKTGGNIHQAEELFSDTFHDALVAAPRMKDINKVYSWLRSIANRRFSDYLRKKYRDKKYYTGREIDGNHPAANEDVTEKLAENEKILMLKDAMENLNTEYKNLLTLKYIDNKTQKEIAVLTNKTESSVDSLLFRARAALKKELNKTKKAFL